MHLDLDTVAGSMPIGLVITDLGPTISYFNGMAERLLAIPHADAIGKKLEDCFATEPQLLDFLTDEATVSQRLQVNGHSLLLSKAPLTKDAAAMGNIIICQKYEAVEAIYKELQTVQELNTELQGILESSFDGIGIVDPQGRLLKLNSSFERITGLNKDEIINQPLKKLVSAGLFSVAPSLIALQQKKRVTMTQEVKTGARVLITSNPVFNNRGEIMRVIANIRDLTELDKLQEESLKYQSMSLKYHSELEALRAAQLLPEDIVARSHEMGHVVEMAVRVAQTDTTALIEGESGVGKEVVARLIHKASPRNKGPFIKINCAAIPETLLESELFGYSSGAFTGAQKGGKLGLFELAQKGTIFLDEIGEMPLTVQAKLLRVIEERVLYRLGGTKPIELDVRVLSATNRDLQDMVNSKLFRQDLYYRLRVLPIVVPPLRKRRQDILPLVHLFLKKLNDQLKTNKHLTSGAMSFLEKYSWPGNVRQLQNVLEALVVSSETNVISENALINILDDAKGQELNKPVIVNKVLPLAEAQELLEKELLRQVARGSSSARQVARILGITHPTAIKKIKQYDLQLKSKEIDNPDHDA